MGDSVEIRSILCEVFEGIEEDTLEYFEGIVCDQGTIDEDSIKESLAPLIEAYGFSESLEAAEITCGEICGRLRGLGMKVDSSDSNPHNQSVLLSKTISLGDTHVSVAEQAAIDKMWGFDKIRLKKNEVIDVSEAASAKYERNAEKEQRKWLADLEAKFVGDEEKHDEISTMTLPEYSGNNRDKDILVSNFDITFAGQLLLESADLRYSPDGHSIMTSLLFCTMRVYKDAYFLLMNI